MEILKAYKYKLKTNKKTKDLLNVQANNARFLWNYFLAMNKRRSEQNRYTVYGSKTKHTKPIPELLGKYGEDNEFQFFYHKKPRYDISKMAKVGSKKGQTILKPKYEAGILFYPEMDKVERFLRKTNEYSFLRDSHSQIVQQKLKDLERAMSDCFKGLRDFPRFKKKGQAVGFRYPQGVTFKNGGVYLPKITGRKKTTGFHNSFKNVKFEGRKCKIKEDGVWIEAAVENVTITKDGEDFFMSVQIAYEKNIKSKIGTIVGIDLGTKDIITTSDGHKLEAKNFLRKSEHKIAKLNRKLSVKQGAKKGEKQSNNYKKVNQMLTKEYRKIRNRRKDFLHKLTTKLSKNHALLVCEDLNVKHMSKSAKGTIEQPGRKVKSKSGLNKSILDQGWYELVRQLEYKTTWYGSTLKKVDPRFTSQKCNSCGFVSKANRKKKTFLCLKCSHKDDSDINAAKNIRAAGLEILASSSKKMTSPMTSSG